MPTRHRLLTFFVPLALSVASCKGASESCDPTDPLCSGGGNGTPVPTTVTVSPTTVMFSAVGETLQLNSTVLDQNGSPMASASVAWSSNDESVATVSGSGLVTAEGPGATTIDATAGDATGSASVMVDDPCAPLGTLTVGDQDGGTLTDTGCTIGNGFYVEPWTLTIGASEAGTVQIDVISSEYDAYVGLFDASLNLIAENDDAHFSGVSSYDLSAHVIESLAEGTYTILVGSSSPGETGSYALYVGEGLPCPENGHISVDEIVFGTLSIDDCSYDGFYADEYAFEVTTEGDYTIDLSSLVIDAFLTVYDPAGNVLGANDDFDDGLDSQLTLTLSPGWYVVEASSFDPDEQGDYTLSIQ